MSSMGMISLTYGIGLIGVTISGSVLLISCSIEVVCYYKLQGVLTAWTRIINKLIINAAEHTPISVHYYLLFVKINLFQIEIVLAE